MRVPVDALRNVTWEDISPSGENLLLTLRSAGGLQLVLGPVERLLIAALQQCQPARPFEGLDIEQLDRLSATVFKPGATLERLRQGNLLRHLLTHTNEEIGYLCGRVSRSVVGQPRPAGKRRARVDYGGLTALHQRLQALGNTRLNARQVRELIDAEVPDFEHRPDRLVGDALLHAASSSDPRRQPKGTMSAHTARAVFEDVVRIIGCRGPEALDLLTLEDIKAAFAGRRVGWDRVSDAWAALSGAAQSRKIAIAKLILPTDEIVFSGRDLPDTRAFGADAVGGLPASQQPLAALLLTLLREARISEVRRLKGREIRVVIGEDAVGPARIVVQIRKAKGGHPSKRIVLVEPWAIEFVEACKTLLRDKDPEQSIVAAWPGKGAPLGQRGPLARAFAQLGTAWHAHLCRTVGATEGNKNGLDRAIIGLKLGHNQLSSTDSYVVLDPQGIGTDSGQPEVLLKATAIARLLGLSERQAKRVRAATGGDALALARRLEEKSSTGRGNRGRRNR